MQFAYIILYKCTFTQGHHEIQICPVLGYSNSLIILDKSAKISYIKPRTLVYKTQDSSVKTIYFFQMRFLDHFLMAGLRLGLLCASDTVYEPCDFLGKTFHK